MSSNTSWYICTYTVLHRKCNECVEELYIFKEHVNRDKIINERVNFDSTWTYGNLYPELPIAKSI